MEPSPGSRVVLVLESALGIGIAIVVVSLRGCSVENENDYEYDNEAEYEHEHEDACASNSTGPTTGQRCLASNRIGMVRTTTRTGRARGKRCGCMTAVAGGQLQRTRSAEGGPNYGFHGFHGWTADVSPVDIRDGHSDTPRSRAVTVMHPSAAPALTRPAGPA